MASILCLAHYCDTHGPTPLMVTEGLPVDCSSCTKYYTESTRRPSTSSLSNRLEGLGLAGVDEGARPTSSSSEKENGSQRGTLQTRAQEQPPAVETPPESPRVVALQSGQNMTNCRRDSNFRKTYDENDKKKFIPCENCALTLPRKREDTSKSQRATGKMDGSGPILRTRKPYERVAMAVPPEQLSPPKSSNSSDSEIAVPSQPRRRPKHPPRAGTSSSNSSFRSTTSHTHYLDYTSTHEPLAPTSFSIVRQSCLRTLSCETLPPSLNQFTSSPTSPFINSPSMAATSTSSGGPIFFGDPLAGYTTAYIFRISDPNARGRRRVYALMALSTHREWQAMQTFSFLSTAFRELASWIQGLAEAEIERNESLALPHGDRGTGTNHSTPTSSFLSGRSRGSDGKFAGMSLRARGLAELVGLPDFFLELHTRFVKLLIELGVILNQ